MKKIALIVGGGKGIRMGSEMPKQFLVLNGRPLIFHTIEKFSGIADEIIVVLPASHFDYWRKLWISYYPGFEILLVEGGETRSQSVLNGLSAIKEHGIVAVHDAVRPLVSKQQIEKLFSEAVRFGNAVPVIPMRESIRIKTGESTQAVNREEYLIVQTPQCFDSEVLMKAYKSPDSNGFSDDASLIESNGGVIHHVEGEVNNIKITFSHDLAIAESIMNARIL